MIVYNFFRNLKPIIELFKPDKVFVAFEGHPKFRYDLFPEYKANRIIKIGKDNEESNALKQEKRAKVYKAKDEIVKLLKFFPVTCVKADNFEADDVIATLAENMRDEDLTILSSDSDYTQLLQKNFKSIKIYNPIKKMFVENPNYPYVYWKCLVGDKSDNIPGFKGIAAKRAEALLKSPKQFEEFLSLEENRANFNIFRKIIEFSKVPDEELVISEGAKDFEQVFKEFERMQFKSITNEASWIKFKSTFDSIKY